MNTPNNKRRRDSRRRMESAFVRLLQTRELEAITVTDICREAGVNRTTFYANYQDIFALAEAIREGLMQDVLELYREESARNYDTAFLTLFQHVQENQLFYKTYFNLTREDNFSYMGFNLQGAVDYHENLHIPHLEYHIIFFQSGFNAILKKWLYGGCKESPEEMASILTAEYTLPQSRRK